MNYLEYDFETENADQAEQLIALLSDEGFEGFEEEGNSLKAFIPEDKLDATAFENVIAKFTSLSYTSTSIENINWNQQWEESFSPVIVEDKIAIRAAFHEPIKNVEKGNHHHTKNEFWHRPSCYNVFNDSANAVIGF